MIPNPTFQAEKGRSPSRVIASVWTFLANHCPGLTDLLETLPGSGTAIAALHDLIEACDRPVPARERIILNLERIVAALAAVVSKDVSEAADNGAPMANIQCAVNWYGAALSDLLREASGGSAARNF